LNRHILFIHIPKTAGTSFRKAAEKYFGEKNTFYDYSPQSPETSKEILTSIYGADDPYRLYKTISRRKHSFLSGHFRVTKYEILYDTLDIVSFLREPVAHVVSHYNHYKNYNNYKKDLEDFIKEPRFRNIQSRLLSPRSLDLYGFFGLTERYNESIDMFNALYGTDIPHMYINSKKEGSVAIEDVDPAILKKIEKLNREDMAFVDAVKERFSVRYSLFKKNLPYTHCFLQINKKNHITGVAFQKESDAAVEVDIYRGEEHLSTVLAKSLRAGQVPHNVPRKGYVGFEYIHKGDDLPDGTLRAVVRATGQEIV